MTFRLQEIFYEFQDQIMNITDIHLPYILVNYICPNLMDVKFYDCLPLRVVIDSVYKELKIIINQKTKIMALHVNEFIFLLHSYK